MYISTAIREVIKVKFFLQIGETAFCNPAMFPSASERATIAGRRLASTLSFLPMPGLPTILHASGELHCSPLNHTIFEQEGNSVEST